VSNKQENIQSKAVFPSAHNLICAWHINKRILAKAKPLIRSELVHIEGDEKFKEVVENYRKSMLELDRYQV